MSDEAEFYIVGIPKPQGSMRHVGHGRIIHSSPKLLPWRDHVMAHIMAKQPDPYDGPVSVRIGIFLTTPKKPKHPLPISRSAGDIDKHARTILDALQLSGIIADDAQVVDLKVSKRYAEDISGVTISIRSLNEPAS
jgi:crossover junction endodeoxyribonuclease RusA